MLVKQYISCVLVLVRESDYLADEEAINNIEISDDYEPTGWIGVQPFTEEEIQQRLRFAENQDNEETVDGNREDSQEETDGDLISNSNSRDTKSSFKNENKVLKN